ncbi:hypothetical protein [Egicoccus sp. AB-alg6-2]|uniref:hypothetical protein n=1 Tax=Egicoccus sp. AB-alg6-2 TaxID=3242692 RepID=UPI00359EA470
MIRVVAYDLGGPVDVAAAAEVLARLEPSIVCVLELPGRQRLRRLAGRAGLRIAARSGRGGSGTAVLVNPGVAISSSGLVPLTGDGPSHQAIRVVAGVGGYRLAVTAARFGPPSDEVGTHPIGMTHFLDSSDAPVVVGCGIAIPAHAAVAEVLAERLQDAHALAGTGGGENAPAMHPTSRQDFLFVDPALDVLGSFVPEEAPVEVASRHRPVVADLAGRNDDATRLPVGERDLDVAPTTPPLTDAPSLGCRIRRRSA